MPAAIVAAAAPALVGTLAGAVLEAVIGLVISQVISFASEALFGKKPKSPDLDSQERSQMIRQAITARRRGYGRVRVSGPLAFIHARGDLGNPNSDKDWLHLLPLLCGHEIDAVEAIYLDDKLLELDEDGDATNAPWVVEGVPYASAWVHLGSDDQVADEVLVDETDGKWTDAHRLRGIAYIHARYFYGFDEKGRDVWPGIRDVRCVCRLAKVYDPRTGLTAWSRNAALCVADYMTTPREEGGLGVASDDIDWDTVTAAANICDEVVTTLDGTEPRYTCDGVFDTDEKPVDVLRKLLSAMAGTAVYTGGAWKLYAGGWAAPTRTLTEDDLRDAMTVTTALSRREAINGVRGTFFSPDRDWQPTDFPPVQSAAYLDEDDGEELWRDAEWNFTTSAAAAQRLSKIDLERARRETIVQFPGKLTCLAIGIHDVVTLDIERYRSVWGRAKTFRVVEWKLSEARGVDGKPGLGVDLVLKEEDAAVYDWSHLVDEQPFEEAPEADLDTAAAKDAPTDFAVFLAAPAEFSGIPYLRATWTPPAQRVKWYELQWREHGEAEWPGSMTAPADATETYLGPVAAAAIYDVRLRAYNSADVPSEWIEADGVALSTDVVAPAAPTAFSATGASTVANLAWTNPADADFRRVRAYRNTVNDSGTATEIVALRTYGAPGAAGAKSDTGLAAGTYWYWLKAEDDSGNLSAFSAGDSATVT